MPIPIIIPETNFSMKSQVVSVPKTLVPKSWSSSRWLGFTLVQIDEVWWPSWYN